MNSNRLVKAMLAVFAVETLSATWFLKIPHAAHCCAVLYFFSGVGISFLLLRFPTLTLPRPDPKGWNTPANHYRLIVAGLVILATWSWCQYWFDDSPIDITNADMLPIIKVMGERFIAGQHSGVYDSIPWIWHGTQPIYLPAMWLPYVPAIFLGIDMRWVAVAGLIFAFITFLFFYRPNTHTYLSFLLGVMAFLLFWWVVADNTPGIVSVAEEGVVIGYYVLLVLALLSGRPLLTGIAISLCMLSRYALVGWVPAYLLYLALEKKWRSLITIVITGVSCFVLLFLLPVGWGTFLRLAKLPGDYVAFAARVWKDSPDVFASAPAFAWFFGPHRIGLLHGLLLALSFSVPLIFIWLGRRHHRSVNLPLAALKINLVVFFSFIDVPYLYLFYTSCFVSLIIVALLLREAEAPG
ncbi:MAG TPA: hypothetical protein VGS79_05255 [Puia sp.]|nr:hypothetical protein [Puia sp.]